MASWIDLADRIANIGGDAHYIGDPAKWLLAIVEKAQEHPQVLNVKGIGPEETVCVIPLAAFEQLLDFAHFPADDDADDALQVGHAPPRSTGVTCEP